MCRFLGIVVKNSFNCNSFEVAIEINHLFIFSYKKTT